MSRNRSNNLSAGAEQGFGGKYLRTGAASTNQWGWCTSADWYAACWFL